MAQLDHRFPGDAFPLIVAHRGASSTHPENTLPSFETAIGLGARIVEVYDGKVPDTMQDLVTLRGVARKTGNIVLGNAFGIVEGIAVDTHVKRLANRLGFSAEGDPDRIEHDLMRLVPRKKWFDFTYVLIDHGRSICQARKPRCAECPVSHLCPSSQV